MKSLIATGACALIGGGMLFFVVKRFVETVVFIRASRRAEGVVVGLSTARNSDGRTMYMPVVEFKAPGETLVRFTSTIASNPPSSKVGERTGVRYLVKKPQAAKIDSFAEIWLVTLVLAVIGLASLFIAFLIFRAR